MSEAELIRLALHEYADMLDRRRRSRTRLPVPYREGRVIRMTSKRRQAGDRESCGTCFTDIEYGGRDDGWHDRGGNHWCDTSGQGWVDQDGVPGKYPHRRHRPGSVFTLPHGARRLLWRPKADRITRRESKDG